MKEDNENPLIEKSLESDGLIPVEVRIVPNDTPMKPGDFLKPKYDAPVFKVSEIAKYSETEIGAIAKRHMEAQLEGIKMGEAFRLNLVHRYPQAMAGSLKGGQYMRKQNFTELRRCLPPSSYGFKALVDLDELERSL
jgi:hypothetical protein